MCDRRGGIVCLHHCVNSDPRKLVWLAGSTLRNSSSDDFCLQNPRHRRSRIHHKNLAHPFPRQRLRVRMHRSVARHHLQRIASIGQQRRIEAVSLLRDLVLQQPPVRLAYPAIPHRKHQVIAVVIMRHPPHRHSGLVLLRRQRLHTSVRCKAHRRRSSRSRRENHLHRRRIWCRSVRRHPRPRLHHHLIHHRRDVLLQIIQRNRIDAPPTPQHRLPLHKPSRRDRKPSVRTHAGPLAPTHQRTLHIPAP